MRRKSYPVLGAQLLRTLFGKIYRGIITRRNLSLVNNGKSILENIQRLGTVKKLGAIICLNTVNRNIPDIQSSSFG